MPSTPQHVYVLTLRKVHAFMLAQGFKPGDLLVNTEIREHDLDDPYRLIHSEQARSYYRNVLALANSEGLGLEIGWTTGLAELGPQGMTQLAAKTIRDALSGAYSNRYLYNLLVEWDVEITDDLMVSRFLSDEQDPALRTFLLERALGTLQAHVEELVGAEASPVKLLVDYPAPRNFRRYEEIFRCPVYFKRDRTEVQYPRRYLELLIPTYDPQVHQVLDSLRGSMQQKLSAGRDVVGDVKLALRRSKGAFPGIEQVADGLAMSSRTLRRKLGQHNLTFQALLDMVRRETAEDYLANTEMSIQRVAEQCGFQDAQNFSQAFKRWAGMSPSDFRRKHRSE